MADSGMNLTLPLSNDGKTVRVVFMSLPGQLTDAEFDRLMAVLDVLKPGIVVESGAEWALRPEAPDAGL